MRSNNFPTQNREKIVYQTGGAMSSCDDCGIVFENIHDLQNHVKRWCQEGSGLQKNVET